MSSHETGRPKRKLILSRETVQALQPTNSSSNQSGGSTGDNASNQSGGSTGDNASNQSGGSTGARMQIGMFPELPRAPRP